VKEPTVPTPSLAKCYIEGDSIAVGTATAEGLSAKYRPTDCKMDAKIGISSTAIIARAHDAELVVISAGSNDPTNPKLVDNLETIRAKATHKVLWIVPAVSAVAADAVKKVAAEHGDDTISFTPGGDHTHPRTYAPIIAQVQADLQNLNKVVEEVAPTQPISQEPSMSFLSFIPFFAVLGVAAFAFLVYKFGLVPATQKVVGWWNTGKADVVAFEQKLVALEQRVVALEKQLTGQK